ncbi:DUF488 family protein [Clostridium neonatale]|uniref:DUF488 domain-containing protein n=1 Tax=Clostridium neonatale TaxID=137838 RepID=UPI003D34461C
MKLYTIGFTKKSAQQFFEILGRNKIQKVIDIRLNNSSQLAGFSKGTDLEFFLKKLCNIKYTHDIELAPTKEILSDYKKKKISWEEYEVKFISLLNKRNSNNNIGNKFYDEIDGVCLLCSEQLANNCHRRLVAEYLKEKLTDYNIEIIHL